MFNLLNRKSFVANKLIMTSTLLLKLLIAVINSSWDEKEIIMMATNKYVILNQNLPLQMLLNYGHRRGSITLMIEWKSINCRQTVFYCSIFITLSVVNIFL